MVPCRKLSTGSISLNNFVTIFVTYLNVFIANDYTVAFYIDTIRRCLYAYIFIGILKRNIMVGQASYKHS